MKDESHIDVERTRANLSKLSKAKLLDLSLTLIIELDRVSGVTSGLQEIEQFISDMKFAAPGREAANELMVFIGQVS